MDYCVTDKGTYIDLHHELLLHLFLLCIVMQ